MPEEIKIIKLDQFPLIYPGDEISKILLDTMERNDLSFQEGDVVVLAQTIISKSLGRIVNLSEVEPSKEAQDIFNSMKYKAEKAKIPLKSPELIQVILEESKNLLKKEHVLITETQHGFICANAGIDKSNIEGEEYVGLLPIDSDREAEKIREDILRHTQKEVAVIISDSFGRPFRKGAIGVAIGVAGIAPLIDKRGDKDLFGHELQSTMIGHVDNLASAAQLAMGESNEGIPAVIIRGYSFPPDPDAHIDSIIREPELDLFRAPDVSEIINQTLQSRRSYKLTFKDTIPDRKILEECISFASWAPSAHNGQYWRYIILEKGSRLRNELIAQMNAKLRKDLENDHKSEKFIEKKIQRTRKNFLDAPSLLLVCLDKSGLELYPDPIRSEKEYLLGVQSVSASITYLLLALHSKQLASCWYCAPLFAEEIVKHTLKLPDTYIPMAFVSVGYLIKQMKAPARKPLGEIIFEIDKENK